jgi:hypothetical protein
LTQERAGLQVEVDEARRALIALRGGAPGSPTGGGNDDVAKANDAAAKAAEDAKAAEETLWDMRHRNAGKFKALQMELDKALSEASGPKHRAAIEKDFADRKMALVREIEHAERTASANVTAMRLRHAGKVAEAETAIAQAAFDSEVELLHKLQAEGEKVDQRILESKVKLGVAIAEINERETDRKAEIYNTDVQAAEATAALKLRTTALTAGKITAIEDNARADNLMAESAFNQKSRELQNAFLKDGRQRTDEYLKAFAEMTYEKASIAKRRADDLTQIEAEATRKRLDYERAYWQEKQSVGERVMQMLRDAELNLIRLTQGETAAKIEEMAREYDAAKAYIDQEIRDATEKAAIMAILDADYADRRDAIFAEEGDQHDKRKGWMRDMQQRLGWTDPMQTWRRMMESGARLALPGPVSGMQVPALATAGGTGGTQLSKLDDIRSLMEDFKLAIVSAAINTGKIEKTIGGG